MQPTLRDVASLPADLNGDTPTPDPEAALRAPSAELRDFQDSLLHLKRAQATLRARARLIEDEDLLGRTEAILVDSIDVATRQLSDVTDELQAHLASPKVPC